MAIFALLACGFSLFSFSSANTAQAAVGINHQINFQGKLVNLNGTNVTDGSYSVVFSLYNVASAGANLWTETQTVTVTNGIFQVNLGSVTTLPASVDFNTDNIYLGIKVGADAEMTPRVQFTSVPQAFNSEKLGGLDKTGFVQNGTVQQASSNFNISGTGVATSLQASTFDTNSAVTLNIGTANASALTISKTGVLSTVAGSLTVTQATTLTGGLINTGSELNTSLALANFATGGTLGTAAATVDTHTTFTINQTTAGQTLTIPSPTTTTAGREIRISNIGTTSFIIGSSTINTNVTASYFWNGTAWTSTGIDTGVTIVGALEGGTANANGATIVGNTVYMQSASASFAGVVNTGAQTFAGAKTFSGATLLQNSTNSTTAFQIQNAAGTSNLLVADTVNNRVGIGTAGPAATLDVAGNVTGSSSLLSTFGTSTSTSGQVYNLKNFLNVVPTAASTASFTGLSNIIATSTANTSGANLTGSATELQVNTGGSTNNSSAIQGDVFVKGTTGTATVFSGFVQSVTGTITNAVVLQASNAQNFSGTITNGVGIEAANQTNATNNTNVLVGTTVSPTGNYSIYNSSAYNNYFAGNLGLGAVAPTNKLTVNALTTSNASTLLAQSAISTGAAANIGQIIQGVASQTADLFQLQNSTATTLATFDSNGGLTIAANTNVLAAVATNGTAATSGINVIGQKGGNTSGTTAQTAGAGAAISLTTGAGGDAPAGSTNGNGGSITLNGGAPGAGAGTPGTRGSIALQTTGGNVGVGTAAPFAQLTVAGRVPTAATGSVATGTGPSAAYVQGRYAYVANYTANTLQIFDVSNPAAPTSVGTVATGTSPNSVYVQGRYAYVANYGSNTLQIFDVSNPAAPTSVGTVAAASRPIAVYVQGRYAYVANYTANTLQIFDVSNPASPTSVGTVATGTNPIGVYVQGRYAYVANYTANTLQTFDVGGTYTQQLEVGGLETGTISSVGNATFNGTAAVNGGLTVSGSTELQGNVGVNGSVNVNNANAVGVALTVRAAASQTGDLLQLQDSSSIVFAKFNANGALTTNGTSNTFAGLATPVIASTTTATTGGTLAAGTYYYVLTATNAIGETIASTSASQVTTGTTSTITVNWTQVAGATGYKVYRNTSNSFTAGTLLASTITNGTTISFTDTGAATTGTSPAATTTGTKTVLQGWGGQSGDLLQLQNSTATTLATFDANGGLTIAANTNVLSSVATNGTTATSGLNVTSQKGGNTSGTTGQTAGTGASQTFLGGAGGDAPAGSTNGNGGSITLNGGAAGVGAGALGSRGAVALQTTGGATTTGGTLSVGSNYGARAFSDGFESGNFAQYSTVSAGAGSATTVDSTIKYNGKYSGKFSIANTAAYASTKIAPSTTMYARAFVYLTGAQGGNIDLLSVTRSSTSIGVALYRDGTSGNLSIYNGGIGSLNSTGAALSLNAWHEIEMRVVTGAPGTMQVWLDGSNVLTINTQNTGTGSFDTLLLGENNAARTSTVYIDDVLADANITTTTSPNTLNVDESLHVGGSSSFGGSLYLQSTADNTTAFQIQNAAGTSLFVADTTNGRIGIGNVAPAYKLDVTGDINSAAYYRQAGNIVVNTTTGANNNFLGSTAGNITATGGQNTATGTGALTALTSGTNNSATGYNALNLTTTGSFNTATGNSALVNNTSGGSNVATGAGSLNNNSTGFSNTAVGNNALYSNTTGSNNTSLGYYAGYQDPTVAAFVTSAALQNATAIGYGSQVQASNSLVLGGQDTNAVNVGIGTTIPLNTFSVSPLDTSAGTASQSTTTVTGVGTAFTTAMVGEQFIFGPGQTGTITAVASATSLTLSTSQTVTSTNYRIHKSGLQVTSGGNVGIGTATPTATLQVAGTGIFRNVSDSATAFQIQNAAGTPVLVTNTVASNVVIASNTTLSSNAVAFTGAGSVIGGSTLTLQANAGNVVINSSTSTLSFIGSANIVAAGSANTKIDSGSGGTLQLGVTNAAAITIGKTASNSATTVNGTALFKPTTGNDSTTAFQIQNSAAGSLFNVDTLNSNVSLNSANSGAIAPFLTGSNALPSGRNHMATAYYNGYVYLAGGTDGTNLFNTVWYAPVNADGSTGAWITASSTIPVLLSGEGAVVVNGYLYLVGGDATNTATPTTAVYSARINSNGTLGAFTTSANPLPQSLDNGVTVTYNGYIYEIGGLGASVGQTTVYYAKSNPDGTTGAWTTSANALPAGAYQMTGGVANGYVYSVGGLNSNGSAVLATINYAKLNADGSTSTWAATTTPLPAARRAGTVTFANGYLYYLGGASTTAASAQSTVYYAKLGTNGNISGAFTTNSNALPAIRNYASTVVSNGYVYEIGGSDGAVFQPTVYYGSTSRIAIAGSVDLVGSGVASLTEGGAGGSLTAGNTSIVGTLTVQDAASFNSNLNVNGTLSLQSTNSSGYVASISNLATASTANTPASSADGLLINIGTANASRTTGNYFVGFAGGGTVAGKIQGSASAVVYTTTGADYAEHFRVLDTAHLPQPGELVSLDSAQSQSVKSATGTSGRLVGVISTSPGFVGNGPICKVDDTNCDADYAKYNVLVALNGQVPTKVSVANGAIHIGDPITASSVTGVGAKATSAGSIVGFALEDTQVDGVIKVVIQPQYFDPLSGNYIQSGTQATLAALNVTGSLSASNLNVSGATKLSNLEVSGSVAVAGNLTVKGAVNLEGSLTVTGATNVADITVNGKIVSKGSAPALAIGTAAGTSTAAQPAPAATVDGTDTAGTVTVTSGTTTTDPGVLAELTFARGFPTGTNFKVALTPVSSSAIDVHVYVEKTATGFKLVSKDKLLTSTSYSFDYIVIGAQQVAATP